MISYAVGGVTKGPIFPLPSANNYNNIAWVYLNDAVSIIVKNRIWSLKNSYDHLGGSSEIYNTKGSFMAVAQQADLHPSDIKWIQQ